MSARNEGLCGYCYQPPAGWDDPDSENWVFADPTPDWVRESAALGPDHPECLKSIAAYLETREQLTGAFE